jgi:XTP/dITP diphosphohydrolase
MNGEAGARVLDLVALMDRLRSPGGCPWDARQTHESLVEYLIEEAYETVEAIEARDRDGLREELGDLLLQVVFHARIAQEDPDDPWTIDDVAVGITEKLIRRHPHVFADVVAGSEAELQASWHAQKAKEKGRESVMDGIPPSLPALVMAGKVLGRSTAYADDIGPSAQYEAARNAFDGVVDEAGLGDLLLALVAMGREQGWDAESALRACIRERMNLVRSLEQGRAPA